MFVIHISAFPKSQKVVFPENESGIAKAHGKKAVA